MSEELAPIVPISDACHWFERVAQDTHRLVASLSKYTDDELLAFRETAERLNNASWIAICAADALIMERAQPVKHRRAGDKEQTGIYAVAVRQAKATGLDPTTIIRNATIFKNFRTILSGASNDPEHLFLVEKLQDKGYWDAASHAPEGRMQEALHYFANQKEANPRFTVREAWRWINEQKAPPVETMLPPLSDNEAVENAFQYVKQGFAMLNDVTAGRLRGQLNGYIEEIEWELKLPPCSIMERLYDLIEQGYDEVDIIRERGGYPRDWVVAWFKRMALEDWVRPFEKPRVEGARGQARTGYVVTDKFLQALKQAKGKGKADEFINLAPGDWRSGL